MLRNPGQFPKWMVLLLLISGCGKSGDQREPVAGQVTFGGKPVVYGSIEFVPDKAKGHSGPATFAEIVDGEFHTRSADDGIFPGPHLVKVTAFPERPVPAVNDDSSNAPVVAGPVPIFLNYPLEAVVQREANQFEIPESAKGYGIKTR